MAEREFEAVIWDMDGVIVDSGPYHFQAWREVFHRRGISFTEEDFRRDFGRRNDTIIRSAMGEGLPVEEVDALAGEKEESYRCGIAGKVKALPGVLRLMQKLRESGIKMAVASSAPPENIRLITEKLDVSRFFDAVVWGREVSEGKPSPQGFLLAARKLGVKPENCVVIEDAVAGVAGAGSAGMRCVAVTNSHSRASLAEADLVVDSLETLAVSDIKKLFA